MIAALGLTFDPAPLVLSGARGRLELEPHVGRVLARLFEDVEKPVERSALLVALVGEGPAPGLPLDDLFRRTLKDVRAALRLFCGAKVSLASRDEAVFLLGVTRPGGPPALRQRKVERPPHVNVATQARMEMDQLRAARVAERSAA